MTDALRKGESITMTTPPPRRKKSKKPFFFFFSHKYQTKPIQIIKTSKTLSNPKRTYSLKLLMPWLCWRMLGLGSFSSLFLLDIDKEDMVLADTTFLTSNFHLLSSSFIFSDDCAFNLNCLSHTKPNQTKNIKTNIWYYIIQRIFLPSTRIFITWFWPPFWRFLLLH